MIPLLLSCLLAGGTWASPQYVRLSDVRVHPHSGDVIGTEITLERLDGRRIAGTLRHFEGSCVAEVVKLSGTLTDGRLSVSGDASGTVVRLEGTLSDKDLRGRLIFELPKQSNVVKVHLRVVATHVHCQQAPQGLQVGPSHRESQ